MVNNNAGKALGGLLGALITVEVARRVIKAVEPKRKKIKRRRKRMPPGFEQNPFSPKIF